MKSVETCSDVGDIAEDSVERKEAVDRAEAGEVVEAEVLLIMIHYDDSVVNEENLVTLVGRLVHQQDDRLQGLSLLGRHFGGRFEVCTWRGKRA